MIYISCVIWWCVVCMFWAKSVIRSYLQYLFLATSMKCFKKTFVTSSFSTGNRLVLGFYLIFLYPIISNYDAFWLPKISFWHPRVIVSGYSHYSFMHKRSGRRCVFGFVVEQALLWFFLFYTGDGTLLQT